MRTRTPLVALHRPVTPAPIWGDHEIAAALQLSIEMAIPDLNGLECMVQDGIVILRGRPATEADQSQIVEIATDIPGVRHVIDRLALPHTPLRRAA